MIKIEVEQSVFIDLPSEEIFAYMSDLENLIAWSSVIIAVRKISPAARCVGARVHSTIRFLGKWLELTFEIVEYDPNHYLTIKSITGVSPCLFCYQFAPTGDGGTIVSQKAVIHLIEGLVELAEPVVRSAVSRQLEYDLLTLKDMLETKTATGLDLSLPDEGS